VPLLGIYIYIAPSPRPLFDSRVPSFFFISSPCVLTHSHYSVAATVRPRICHKYISDPPPCIYISLRITHISPKIAHPPRLTRLILHSHSHSVVAGGFGEISSAIRAIPGTSLRIRFWSSSSASSGMSRPGLAGVPVIKSRVKKARIPMERLLGEPKPTGKSTTGT